MVVIDLCCKWLAGRINLSTRLFTVVLFTYLIPSAIASDVGAGFFVTRDGYFVTNHRTVINAGSAAIVIRDKFGSQFEAVVVATDAANDLALLKARGSFAAIPIVKSSEVRNGNRVLIVAHRNDISRRSGTGLTKAVVSSLTGLQGVPNVLSVALPQGADEPGGPLFTTEGNVIGVFTARNRPRLAADDGRTPAETSAFAVKSDHLLALLATEKAAWAQLLPRNVPTARTYGQLAKAIGRAVGMVLTLAPDISVPSAALPQPPHAEISASGAATAPVPATITSAEASPATSSPAASSAEEMFKTGHSALLRQDYPAAYQWLSQAAEQGNAKAQADLAGMYLEGQGVDKNPLTAANWFRKAALKGEAQSGENLGILFRDGLGVEQDDIEAAWWFQRAAKQGSPSAQANLGLMYEDGRGVRQDDAEAVQWFLRAARQGNALAQYRLGIHYVDGRGVVKDDAEALKWLTQSARQGFVQAQDYLRASGVSPPAVSTP